MQGPSTIIVADGLRAIFSFLEMIRKARSTTVMELTEFRCDGGRRVGLEPYELATALLSLTIANSELEFVPEDVLSLTNLTFLDLRFNLLKQFPEAAQVSSQPTVALSEPSVRVFPTPILSADGFPVPRDALAR